jgi:ABC-type amino acid transport substrate-binding protein
MADDIDLSKRTLVTGALGAAGLGVVAPMGAIREAKAQGLQTGIRDESVLSKVRKERVLRIGFALTPPLFFVDPKSGNPTGVFKDLCDMMCKEMEVQPKYQEVTWANSTLGLRAGDFDLFGSSLTVNTPRLLTIDFVGPLWSKGTLFFTRKNNIHKFKSAADFNREDVTFSLSLGTNEAQRVPLMFPKAKVVTMGGQTWLAAEPVRSGKADLFGTADIDVMLYQSKNKDWAVIVDPEHPIDRRWTTWAIRYGDPEWKNFLNNWTLNLVTSGEVQRIYDDYVGRMLKG